MNFLRLARVVVACMLCGVLVPVPSGAQEGDHLRVATVAVDVGGLSFYAADEGFFKKAGLDVELVTASGSFATAAAVEAGKIDIAATTVLAIALAHERGLNFVLVAPAGAYTSTMPTAGLIVARSSTARTAKDLTGKTIAVNTLHSIGEIGARAWLDQNGVDLQTLHFIEMPYTAMDTALASGHIDAAIMEEPVLSKVLATHARLLAHAYDAIDKDFAEGAYYTTPDFVRTHLDLVRRFRAVVTQTARWANANQATSARILEKYTRVPAAEMTHRVHYHDQLDPARLQPLINAAAKYGQLKAPFPANDLIAQGL